MYMQMDTSFFYLKKLKTVHIHIAPATAILVASIYVQPLSANNFKFESTLL